MKGRRKKLCAGLLLILLLMQPLAVRAEETSGPQESDGRTQTEDTDRITDELIGELELDEMEQFLSQQQEEDGLNISFGELIKGFLSGEEHFDISRAVDKSRFGITPRNSFSSISLISPTPCIG